MTFWELVREWFGVVLALVAIGYELLTSIMSSDLNKEISQSPAIDSFIGILSIVAFAMFGIVTYGTFRDKNIIHGIISILVCFVLLIVIGLSSHWFTKWTSQLGHPAALQIARFLALAGVSYEAALKFHWI